MRSLMLLVAVLVLAGCGKLTEANYAQLKAGMTGEQVEAVLGAADSCEETFAFRSCEWGDESRYIRVKFIGDKVIALSKKDLR